MTQTIKSRKKKKSGPEFVATCGAGMEQLVAAEIKEHGGDDIETRPGAVSWKGSLETGYRMCLWSRFASRILLEIARFQAPDTDALYRHALQLDWEAHFTRKKTFAVFATISESPITHSKFAALRIKDAIADHFRKKTGKRPDVEPGNPDIRINLHLHGEEAVLALDLSGESLHRRGYRASSVEAPLKETLAAAIVHLAGFAGDFPAGDVVLDPMCGSGTLLIEAAMIYGDIAPGLQRETFGFTAWEQHNPKLWDRLVDEALQREEKGMHKPWPRFIGLDPDPAAVKAARKNIVAAGFKDQITVNRQQLAFLQRPHDTGMLLVNPPYGDRLSEKETVKYLYRCLGRKIGTELHGWRIGFFAANPDFADILKVKWEQTFNLYNGPIKCRLHQGLAEKLEETEDTYPVLNRPDPDMEGIDLANRLIKNCTPLLDWAKQEDITCFRIYDADMPEYNFAVDLYGPFVHVQEYAPPASIDAKKAGQRFQTGLNVIRHVLGIPPSRLFIKTRKIQKGKSQYNKQSGSGKLYEVREGQCRFLVNFTDYLDTGLFLDHRATRAMLGRLASGKKFLNLYGYTGSATVHALMNNAIATTTVDASKTYLQRTMANFALNGFGGPQHITVEQDCIKWLSNSGDRFGLIFIDPPTFSNDRHQKITFSVQNDHEQLLRLGMKRLARDGLLIFSTNFRKFALADALERDFAVQEITATTIPEDFKRKTPIHRCWEFRHRADETETA